MSFVFSHDGHTYCLDTEGGEVHLQELPRAPEPEPPLEPCDEA